MTPRVVVYRPSEYEQLLARHATPGQAAFFLRTRGESSSRSPSAIGLSLRPASHQSARYELRVGGQAESQSSSGLIVATGTGRSGQSRSIRSERRSVLEVPAPTDPSLTLFVRKA